MVAFQLGCWAVAEDRSPHVSGVGGEDDARKSCIERGGEPVYAVDSEPLRVTLGCHFRDQGITEHGSDQVFKMPHLSEPKGETKAEEQDGHTTKGALQKPSPAAKTSSEGSQRQTISSPPVSDDRQEAVVQSGDETKEEVEAETETEIQRPSWVPDLGKEFEQNSRGSSIRPPATVAVNRKNVENGAWPATEIWVSGGGLLLAVVALFTLRMLLRLRELGD